jgi:peptide/nickel transport system substrate-binding protein
MQRRTVLAGAAFIASEGLLGIGRLAAQQPKHGGAASIAQQGTVNMLDLHTTQVTAIRNIAMHIFECLVTRDEHMNPIADLATGWTVANDGLSYTFPLRQGITFHNGKQLTSADVKASFERYARVGMEPDALTDVVTTETPDATTVVFRLRNRVPTFIEQISSIRAPIVIMPTEESSKEPGKIAAIGTGPYALDRFPDGSTVTLRKYQNYRPNDAQDGTSGFGGRKLAYFDSLTFHNVPEPGCADRRTADRSLRCGRGTPTHYCETPQHGFENQDLHSEGLGHRREPDQPCHATDRQFADPPRHAGSAGHG